MRFSICQDSQRGARKTNQDRIGYAHTTNSLLLVVCDGMGGHLYGEVAAQITVQTIEKIFQQQARSSLQDPCQFLQDAMMAAHIEIHRHRAGRGLAESPRTTCVAAIFQNNTAWWAHAGDSRLYWLRAGRILEVTRDHSQLEAMIAAKLPEDTDHLADLPNRNQLFNCLGAPAMPLIELADPVRINPGDCFLLCSDGLWGSLKENVIANAFQGGEVMQAVPYLVKQALSEAGAAADNVSALAMCWYGDSVDSTPISAFSPSTIETGTAFSTTITTNSNASTDPMSEAAIESAIAEIRHAIARSQKTGPKGV